MTCKSSVCLERDIKTNWVFWSLKLTRLSAPQLAILSRSSLREEIVSTLETSLVLKEGLFGKIVEECKVESSAYEWIGLDVTDRRSLMKMRKRVGDKTQPCGTPLLIDRGGETDPSTTTDKDLSERKLSRSEQIEGEKPKEGSLESNDLCHTLSNALEMSRATTKDSP